MHAWRNKSHQVLIQCMWCLQLHAEPEFDSARDISGGGFARPCLNAIGRGKGHVEEQREKSNGRSIKFPVVKTFACTLPVPVDDNEGLA